MPGRRTIELWWSSLSDDQRHEVVAVTGLLAEWMVTELHAAGILIVPMMMPGNKLGFLMTAQLREYVDAKRDEFGEQRADHIPL